MAIAGDQVRLLKGEAMLFVWGDPDGNHTRCAVYGSFLFSVLGPQTHVAYRSLRDEPTLKPTAHIFVGSKAPLQEILDDLPQHDGYP